MNFLTRTAVFLSLSALILTACEDGEGFSFGKKETTGEEGAETETAPAARTVLKDVERPDIFNVTEAALWDGRPSLGGVWVAHPDISEPERVILTNTKNGKSVPGALFRRERNNPGPRIQASSDAAAALGMIAGQPVDLKVLVVRQEEVVIEPEPQPEPEEDQLSKEELAAAGVVAETEEGETPAVEEKPKRPNFFQRLFRKKPATNTAGVAAAAATVDDASAPAVETSTLDPVSTGAAAAIARAESSQAPRARPERPAAEAAAPAPAPAPASDLKNPYIQVGQFSVEANADSAASNLRQSGIVPTILETDGGAWRVVIGPVSTADDQAALLAQVKNLGFADAFLTPR